MELSIEELYRIKTALEWTAADYGPADEIIMSLIAKVDNAISLLSKPTVFVQVQ